MNRRRSLLARLALLLVVAAAAARIAEAALGRRGGRENADGDGLASSASAPTLDAGQATPEEQEETNRRVLADWTREDIEEALANPRVPPRLP